MIIKLRITKAIMAIQIIIVTIIDRNTNNSNSKGARSAGWQGQKLLKSRKQPGEL